MKKIFLLSVICISFASCKKEEIIVNEVVTNNYQVTDYISPVPLYSVTIKNDTLTCDAENLIYQYVKISDTEFLNSRVYWKNLDKWTTWDQGVKSYFSNNTLFINL